MEFDLKVLLDPKKCWSRNEVLLNPSPVPKLSGIYAWYFKEIPSKVPIKGCIVHQGLTLLYVGIAPRRPTKSGKKSERNLYTRLHFHYRGNAYGSTLRMSLGCLLMEKLGIRLQHKRGVTDYKFGGGEDKLSEWMGMNAFVTWMASDDPWTIEDELIHTISLPLNIKGNANHPFYIQLKAIRKACKEDAIVKED